MCLDDERGVIRYDRQSGIGAFSRDVNASRGKAERSPRQVVARHDHALDVAELVKGVKKRL